MVDSESIVSESIVAVAVVVVVVVAYRNSDAVGMEYVVDGRHYPVDRELQSLLSSG